jgi:hypothetical protein
MPKVATIAYVPRRDSLYPRHFLQNIEAYRHEHPILFFSDYNKQRYADFIQVPSPQPLKNSKNKTAVQNFLFLNAISIARENGLDRFLYLECDCRVGCDGWDEMMFQDWRDGAVVAGTPNLFNTEDIPRQHWPEIQSYMADYSAVTGLPVAQFSANPKTKRLGSCMFMMGAGAIYDTSAMLDLFPNYTNCINSYACRTAAFDLHIGLRLFQIHSVNALKFMPFLTKSFSGFGNKVLNIDQRVERLRSGKACLIHQYKHKSDLLFRNERERLPSSERPGQFNQQV